MLTLKVPTITEITIILSDHKITNIISNKTEFNLFDRKWIYRVFCDTIDNIVEVMNMCNGGSCSGDACKIGLPSDQKWDDGAVAINPDDTIADGVDKLNELLKELLPEPPLPLDALIFPLAFKSGYLAASPYVNQSLAGTYYDKLINVSSTTADTNNTDRFSDADKGILQLEINSEVVDAFNLEEFFNPNEKDGCQTNVPAMSPNNKIEVIEICKYNNFSGYQKGKARVYLDFEVGFNEFKLSHIINTSIRETSLYKLFYDDGNRPSVNITNFEVVSANSVLKYLSGVVYYDYGTHIQLGLSAQDLFNKTYVEKPVEFWASAIAMLNIAWNDANSSGYTIPPNYDDNWSYTNVLSFNKRTSGKIFVYNARAKDPFGYGNLKTFSRDKFLYNTYDIRSTDKHEYFTDEYYRLPINDYDTIPTNITDQWDSSQLLNNGNAQVFVDRLVYPQINFTVDYEPQPQQADYSSFSGDQLYLRAFRDLNIAHNSGNLYLRNINFDDIVSGKVGLYIKLPTQTGWLDLSRDFNTALFTGADGDGALVSHSQSGDLLKISWTSGTFSTANSGWMYILKIILKDKNIEITELYDFGG